MGFVIICVYIIRKENTNISNKYLTNNSSLKHLQQYRFNGNGIVIFVFNHIVRITVCHWQNLITEN